jgi:hypothetical protein
VAVKLSVCLLLMACGSKFVSVSVANDMYSETLHAIYSNLQVVLLSLCIISILLTSNPCFVISKMPYILNIRNVSYVSSHLLLSTYW